MLITLSMQQTIELYQEQPLQESVMHVS